MYFILKMKMEGTLLGPTGANVLIELLFTTLSLGSSSSETFTFITIVRLFVSATNLHNAALDRKLMFLVEGRNV